MRSVAFGIAPGGADGGILEGFGRAHDVTPGLYHQCVTSSEAKRLLEQLRAQHDLLERVATGTDSIKDVNGDYRDRRDRLVPLLAALGQDDPFPWRDLWIYWAEEAKPLATYADRRASLSARITPPERFCLTFDVGPSPEGVDSWTPGQEPPPTWTRTHTRLDSMKRTFKRSVDLDDFQDVARRCREIIIDATDLVHDAWMVPPGKELPKRNDAKERMDQICAAILTGSTNRHLRSLLQKTMALAQYVTHGTKITRLEAQAAAQSTILLVSTLQELERVALNEPVDDDDPDDPEDLTDFATDYWTPPTQGSVEDDPPDVQLYDQSGA